MSPLVFGQNEFSGGGGMKKYKTKATAKIGNPAAYYIDFNVFVLYYLGYSEVNHGVSRNYYYRYFIDSNIGYCKKNNEEI